ncbi:MAG: SDR family oxidoreductase [Actinomycetota bacterium]
MQSIFITGAGSGIGRATAVRFHTEGWLVGCYDVDERALAALHDELGERCVTGVLDVRSTPAFAEAIRAFGIVSGGRLDVMFNNAGIAVGGWFDEVPLADSLRVVDVNLVGVLNGIHAAMPLLQTTPNSLCLTTSSSAATFGAPGLAVYAATKYAVKGLTEALSVELVRFDSRAADISPGVIDTPLWDTSSWTSGETSRRFPNVAKANADRTDANRTLPPEDVAACAWYAYHGNRIHWYVPPELVDRDREKAAHPERLRDELIAQQQLHQR